MCNSTIAHSSNVAQPMGCTFVVMSAHRPTLRSVWKTFPVVALVAATVAYTLGADPYWSLAVGVLVPLLPAFALGVLRGAATPGAREEPAALAMSGTEFEDHVARLARTTGEPVIMTPVTGDFGVDLIVGHRPNRLAVQCKRQSRPVGTGAVQEVVAGAAAHDCTHTMVVTNHSFTPAARKLAEVHGCVLVGGEDMTRLASTIKRLVG